MLYDDIIQLMKTSEVKITTTASMWYRQFAGQNEELIDNAESYALLSDALKFNLGPRSLSEDLKLNLEKYVSVARNNVAKFHTAGVDLAAGTDNPFYWAPWALHTELEVLVQSGFTPLEALIAATKNAACVLRAENDIGTIEVGKQADLVILDADPLEDIRNTRKIWKVLQGGKVIDRESLKDWLKREAKAVAEIGK